MHNIIILAHFIKIYTEKSLISISDDQGFSVNYRANDSLIFFSLVSLRITREMVFYSKVEKCLMVRTI